MHRPATIALALAAAAIALVLALLATETLTSSRGGHPREEVTAAAVGDGGSRPGHPRASLGALGLPTLLATPRPTGAPVAVTVTGGPAGPPVPPDFLGLSFEVRSLPRIAAYAAGGDLAGLLRSLGPGVLRFGGVSADLESAWVPSGSAAPRWAGTAIAGADLAGVAALARETGWRVLLTVDLGHYDPAAAAREAAAARALLGGRLAGIELGNEPDAYVRKELRSRGWSFAAYRRQAAAYRAAIQTAAPGVPIAGPDASSGLPGLAWVRAAAVDLRPALLTDHYYPLSSCGSTPTAAELLSPVTRSAESAMLARLAAIARARGAPLRLDETNNVSCEGQPGVSDTFAAALWALDFTARAMDSGIAGVNFHDLLDRHTSYSPLAAAGRRALAAGALHARPEWYALLAARALLGSRPLRARVAPAGAAETLTASAARAPDGSLRLVLVDFDPPGSRPLAVRLRVAGRFAGGSVLRLTAPFPRASAGVRLGGRAVAPDGAWSAPAALPGVYRQGGPLALAMPASSAAVVTLYPR